MNDFQRQEPGFYTNSSGEVIRRMSAGNWSLASKAGDASGFSTLRSARQFYAELTGEPTAPAKSVKSFADVTIYSHKRGYSIYGCPEVCEILADSRVDTGLPGTIEAVPGKHGRPGGYRITSDLRDDLWHLLQELCHGQVLRTVKGRDRSDLVIPPLGSLLA